MCQSGKLARCNKRPQLNTRNGNENLPKTSQGEANHEVLKEQSYRSEAKIKCSRTQKMQYWFRSLLAE